MGRALLDQRCGLVGEEVLLANKRRCCWIFALARLASLAFWLSASTTLLWLVVTAYRHDIVVAGWIVANAVVAGWIGLLPML
jgi:hypothetical protein